MELSKIQQNAGIEIVLNGGKNEMDAATIPIQWFFSSEFAVRKPTYVIIVEQNQQEIEDDPYGHKGRRYICKVSEVVKFIQLFSPGLHRVAVVAFAGQNAKEVADEYMITVRRDNYEKSLRLDYIENPERFSVKKVETQQEDEDDYEDFDTSAKELDLIATCVRFMVPAELFAKKPETKWGKMMWQYVNVSFNTNPQDECAYRKRKIFAFTLQPILYLLYFILKYLFAGTLYATYVLLGSIFVWFFGFQPTPILKHMKLAFLCKDRSYRKHGWYSQWSVLEHHNYRKIINYDKDDNCSYKRKRIIPFHLTILLILATSSVYFLVLYWEIILPHLFVRLGIFLLLCSIGYILFRLSKIMVKKYKSRISEKKVNKVIRKNKIEKEKQLAEIDWQQKYQSWLENYLTLANKPSHVDLKNIPKPLLKAERTVQHFRISFWSLKTKICRPFSN